MTVQRKYAERAAAALADLLRDGADPAQAADIIEAKMGDAARDREREEQKHLLDVEASAEARLKHLLGASPAVIYSFRAQGDFAPTFVSENITRLFGYRPSEYLEHPDFWRVHVHPDDFERVEAEQADLFDDGGHTAEYRFRKKDGSYCWVSDEQHLLRDEKGEPVEIVGSWSDITARRAAEAAEEQARGRLSVLLESAPAVVYSFKASGDYAPTFVSENIKRLLGYCPEKYLEHPDFWRGNVHPEDLAQVEAEQQKLFDKGRHTAEYRFRKRNGKYIWVSDEQYLLRGDDGQPLEIVGSWSNITARKEAEAAESALKARFALMLQTAPSVVYSFKASGDFAPTFISENVKRVLGYAPDDYLTKPDFWRSRVHPEDLAAVEREQAKLFDQDHHVAEYRFRRHDGIYVWVNDEQRLIRDAHGNPVEVVGSWSEITARKTAEQAALQASEQRLTDAIEAISEGFSLFDAEDKFVLGNHKFAELFDHGSGPPRPGVPYEQILRAAVAKGLISDAEQNAESWLRQRLEQHRHPGDPLLERWSQGRWMQVSERGTENKGTVAVYSDLTDIKESERRAAAANQLIMQSLRYASRIQAAILPAREELSSVTADHFLIWEPRDIVGGDFFWFQPLQDGYAVIVGDCTGHGVPGAFMTLIAWGLLDRMLHRAPSNNPSQVLSGLHQGVQSLLGQDHQVGETDDGLEAGICFVSPKQRQLTFAGARFSLWRANSGEVIEIKGDRKGVGYRRYPRETAFTNVEIELNDGDRFYLTTDGLIDQIGGPRGRSFGKKRFQSLLKQTYAEPMTTQADQLRQSFAKYQGPELRRDDLTVLGFTPLSSFTQLPS